MINPKNKKISGFSLIEVMLSISIFSLIVSVFVGSILFGEESTSLAGKRARASFLAEEGIEVVRNIRDENFSNLSDGDYGLAILGNQWIFSGVSDSTDIFTRSINIQTIDVDRKLITSTVTWQQNASRDGQVILTTYLTKWKI